MATIRCVPRLRAGIDSPEDGYRALLAAVYVRAVADLTLPGRQSNAVQFLRSPGARQCAQDYLGINLPEDIDRQFLAKVR